MPLLLAPLDRHGEAYRCHPLFRDLLARELRENEPELRAELHRRAADWFEAQGDLEAALLHAEGSGDTDRMARIVAAIALPAYYRGRVDDVEGWLDKFDETELERLPRGRRHRRLAACTPRPPRRRRALARRGRARSRRRSLRRTGDLASACGVVP